MTYITNYLLRALRTQTILAFIYTPIVISWGLPISYMSLIGNIVFLPFLTLFLIFSSIIFITESFAIPNSYLCTFLSYFTESWFNVLQYGSPSWLIGFPDPGVIPLLIIPLVGILIYFFTKYYSLKTQCLILSPILIVLLFLYKYVPSTPTHVALSYKNSQTMNYDASRRRLVIPKIRIYKKSFESWLVYQARSTLYKQIGTADIRTIILKNPSPSTRRTIKTLQPITLHKTLLSIKENMQKKCTAISFL